MLVLRTSNGQNFCKLINLDDITLIPLPFSLLYFPGNSLFIGVLIGHSKGLVRKNGVVRKKGVVTVKGVVRVKGWLG